MSDSDMQLLEGIHPVFPDDVPRLVEVWEASVRATHDFIQEADIRFLRPIMRENVYAALDLRCVRDVEGRLAAFIGLSGSRVESLFVHPDLRGRGVGRMLLEWAIRERGATEVDVNEQNEQAVGFYRRLGFKIEGRSPVDTLGKPYPLLHMRWVEPPLSPGGVES